MHWGGKASRTNGEFCTSNPLSPDVTVTPATSDSFSCPTFQPIFDATDMDPLHSIVVSSRPTHVTLWEWRKRKPGYVPGLPSHLRSDRPAPNPASAAGDAALPALRDPRGVLHRRADAAQAPRPLALLRPLPREPFPPNGGTTQPADGSMVIIRTVDVNLHNCECSIQHHRT